MTLLEKNNLPNNWLELFTKSYKKAENSGFFKYASAVRLATVSKLGVPSLRVVLLKSYDEKGFVIYTNMKSRKGKQLQENPYAALYFYWPQINEQLEVEGRIEIIQDKESDNYFASRPFFSKVGAHASKQSYSMGCRIEFLIRIVFFTIKYFLKNKVDRPSHWRGFRIIPEKINSIQPRFC